MNVCMHGFHIWFVMYRMATQIGIENAMKCSAACALQCDQCAAPLIETWHLHGTLNPYDACVSI